MTVKKRPMVFTPDILRVKRNAQDKTKRDSVSRAEYHALEKRVTALEKANAAR